MQMLRHNDTLLNFSGRLPGSSRLQTVSAGSEDLVQKIQELESTILCEKTSFQARISQLESTLQETLLNKQAALESKANAEKRLAQTVEELAETSQNNTEAKETLPILRHNFDENLVSLGKFKEQTKLLIAQLNEINKKLGEHSEANAKYKEYKKLTNQCSKLQEDYKKITGEVANLERIKARLHTKIAKLENIVRQDIQLKEKMKKKTPQEEINDKIITVKRTTKIFKTLTILIVRK